MNHGEAILHVEIWCNLVDNVFDEFWRILFFASVETEIFEQNYALLICERSFWQRCKADFFIQKLTEARSDWAK